MSPFVYLQIWIPNGASEVPRSTIQSTENPISVFCTLRPGQPRRFTRQTNFDDRVSCWNVFVVWVVSVLDLGLDGRCR